MGQLLPDRRAIFGRTVASFRDLERADRVAGVGRPRAPLARTPRQERPAAKDEARGGSEAPAKSATAPAAAEGTAPPANRNLLQWAIHASGPIGGFLLLLSIYFTALVIRLFMEFRVSEAVRSPSSTSSKPRSATRSSRMRTTSARTTTRSWRGWCGPGSPTCPAAAPRPRRPCRRSPKRW